MHSDFLQGGITGSFPAVSCIKSIISDFRTKKSQAVGFCIKTVKAANSLFLKFLRFSCIIHCNLLTSLIKISRDPFSVESGSS